MSSPTIRSSLRVTLSPPGFGSAASSGRSRARSAAVPGPVAMLPPVSRTAFARRTAWSAKRRSSVAAPAASGGATSSRRASARSRASRTRARARPRREPRAAARSRPDRPAPRCGSRAAAAARAPPAGGEIDRLGERRIGRSERDGRALHQRDGRSLRAPLAAARCAAPSAPACGAAFASAARSSAAGANGVALRVDREADAGPARAPSPPRALHHLDQQATRRQARPRAPTRSRDGGQRARPRRGASTGADRRRAGRRSRPRSPRC